MSSIDRAEKILNLVQSFDLESVPALFADQGVIELPYRPGGYPTRMVGRTEIARFLRAVPKLYAEISLGDRRFYELNDQHRIITEYVGSGTTTVDKPYRNNYIAIFEFDSEGRCTLWREYFDPSVVMKAITE